MKKLLYVSSIELDKATGVTKKVLQQIKALRNIGYEVSYFAIENDECVFIDENENKTKISRLFKNKIIYNIQYLNLVKKHVKNHSKYDVIYIRKFFSNPIFLLLIKIAKNKGSKVIEEIPTYPYDEECEKSSSFSLRLSIKVDQFFRKKETNYIDYYVTYSEDKEIFGLPAVPIINGIDTESVKPIEFDKNAKSLNIMCIAVMEYWQGYDRLIKSLANYYADTKNKKGMDIYLHFVGDGTKLEEWKCLTKDLALSDYVTFYGFKEGNELDQIYESCQLGCAPLGANRKNLKKISSLKVKEYIAKGIPFIYSTPERYIDNFKFCFKIEDDESLFDLNEIVGFYESVCLEYSLKEMRQFAKEHYDWEKLMKEAVSQ